jgi:NADPH:quinone reductase-like Zn-dependent oxidoreductase
VNYKSVIITKIGGPEVLQLVDTPLRIPDDNETRIKILYAGVGFTDILMRYGNYIYAPKIPFVPGYEIVGIVDLVGKGVTGISVGQRVAALTVHGGYAEYIYLPPENLIPVPSELAASEAVSLILNYVTAYQMLHRMAHVQEGQTILITGASGGVGSALLQLGRLAGLKTMYGLTSKKKHELVAQLGGIPIDYTKTDFLDYVRSREPHGIDAVFDSIGGRFALSGYRTLRRDGILVSFGVTGAIKNGKVNKFSTLVSYITPSILNLLPDGKRATFYGITRLYRKDPNQFREDLQKLFRLLAERKIKPIIAGIIPLSEATKANEMLERGDVQGKLVLRCGSGI